ncbi:MAG: GNAT family N-acetyltransferase [Methanoregulaceae archaeon]
MVTLRALAPSDIPVIKAWPAYPDEFLDLDYALRDGGWLDTYGARADTRILVAESDGCLVGFSILTDNEGESAEFRIALHPSRIGTGFGKNLALLTLASGFSCPDTLRIQLIVRKNNPRARRLYERIGFAPAGECSKEIAGRSVGFYRMEIERDRFYEVNQK